MSKNAKLAWSLLGLGAGMACVVALIQSSNSIEKSSIVALVVLGGLFFSFGSYGLRLFHAPFPIGTWARAVLILGIVWGGMAWLGSSVWPISCSLAVDVTSTVIARVHLRAKWLPSGQTEVYKPLFQDLFHEWVVNIVPNKETSQVVVSVQDARKPADNIRIVPPDNVALSEPKAGWVSGFDEPTQTPDFYVRTVTFSSLAKPGTITIRRPIRSHIGENTITSLDLDLDREVRASAEKCSIVINPLSTAKNPLSGENPQFRKLTEQLNALLVQKVAGGPVTTRLDPDEPYPPLEVNESELIQELKCNSSPCTTISVTMAEKTRVH